MQSYLKFWYNKKHIISRWHEQMPEHMYQGTCKTNDLHNDGPTSWTSGHDTDSYYSVSYSLFIYLGFYVAFNTVQVISRRVVGRAEETST